MLETWSSLSRGAGNSILIQLLWYHIFFFHNTLALICILSSTLKAACKCTGFVHCTSSQHVECFLRCCWARCSNDLNNDLTCWAVRRFHKGSSWIKAENLGYARHCACVGSTCWALLCKCTRLCWATHGWPRNKENVEPCWAKNFSSFKCDSATEDSTPLNTSQQGVQMRLTCWAQHVDSLHSGQIQCICTRSREWHLARLKISPLYANKWQTFWNLGL